MASRRSSTLSGSSRAFSNDLGLSLDAPGVSPDIYIRVPAAKESIFRGAVLRDGVPVSDVVQVWLDAGAYPARGPEQADMIYRKVLKPLLGKVRQ